MHSSAVKPSRPGPEADGAGSCYATVAADRIYRCVCARALPDKGSVTLVVDRQVADVFMHFWALRWCLMMCHTAMMHVVTGRAAHLLHLTFKGL